VLPILGSVDKCAGLLKRAVAAVAFWNAPPKQGRWRARGTASVRAGHSSNLGGQVNLERRPVSRAQNCHKVGAVAVSKGAGEGSRMSTAVQTEYHTVVKAGGPSTRASSKSAHGEEVSHHESIEGESRPSVDVERVSRAELWPAGKKVGVLLRHSYHVKSWLLKQGCTSPCGGGPGGNKGSRFRRQCSKGVETSHAVRCRELFVLKKQVFKLASIEGHFIEPPDRGARRGVQGKNGVISLVLCKEREMRSESGVGFKFSAIGGRAGNSELISSKKVGIDFTRKGSRPFKSAAFARRLPACSWGHDVSEVSLSCRRSR